MWGVITAEEMIGIVHVLRGVLTPLFNKRLLGTCFRFLKEAVGPLYKGEQHKTKTHNFSAYSPKNPPKV